jgi:hypothetical protein
MSAVYESKELFLPVEEEGQWIVLTDAIHPVVGIGTFPSAYEAARYISRVATEGHWTMIPLLAPWEFPGGQEPEEPEPPTEQQQELPYAS